MLHLIEILLVEDLAALRIVEVVRKGHPGGRMPLIEVGRQVGPRHQMEVVELNHQPAVARNWSTCWVNSSVCSSGTRWPHCGTVCRRAPLMSRAYAAPCASGRK